MIVRPKYSWIRMLFVWHGSVIAVVLPHLIFLFVLSCLSVYFYTELHDYRLTITTVPFNLMGVALAIFIAFRNNASYDRFWEARKLWGMLLTRTRALTRQAVALPLPAQPEVAARTFVNLLIAYAYALKHQLRRTDSEHDLQQLLAAEVYARVAQARFKPALLLLIMSEWVREQRQHQLLSDIAALAMEENLNQLSDVLGGCERIANTPIPYPYRVLLNRTVYGYCLLLPFGLVSTIGLMTPLITLFVSYTFLALDAIADELEEPFGMAPNDLALDAMCRTIESSLLEMTGQAVLEDIQVNQDFILT